MTDWREYQNEAAFMLFYPGDHERCSEAHFTVPSPPHCVIVMVEGVHPCLCADPDLCTSTTKHTTPKPTESELSTAPPTLSIAPPTIPQEPQLSTDDQQTTASTVPVPDHPTEGHVTTVPATPAIVPPKTSHKSFITTSGKPFTTSVIKNLPKTDNPVTNASETPAVVARIPGPNTDNNSDASTDDQQTTASTVPVPDHPTEGHITTVPATPAIVPPKTSQKSFITTSGKPFTTSAIKNLPKTDNPVTNASETPAVVARIPGPNTDNNSDASTDDQQTTASTKPVPDHPTEGHVTTVPATPAIVPPKTSHKSFITTSGKPFTTSAIKNLPKTDNPVTNASETPAVVARIPGPNTDNNSDASTDDQQTTASTVPVPDHPTEGHVTTVPATPAIVPPKTSQKSFITTSGKPFTTSAIKNLPKTDNPVTNASETPAVVARIPGPNTDNNSNASMVLQYFNKFHQPMDNMSKFTSTATVAATTTNTLWTSPPTTEISKTTAYPIVGQSDTVSPATIGISQTEPSTTAVAIPETVTSQIKSTLMSESTQTSLTSTSDNGYNHTTSDIPGNATDTLLGVFPYEDENIKIQTTTNSSVNNIFIEPQVDLDSRRSEREIVALEASLAAVCILLLFLLGFIRYRIYRIKKKGKSSIKHTSLLESTNNKDPSTIHTQDASPIHTQPTFTAPTSHKDPEPTVSNLTENSRLNTVQSQDKTHNNDPYMRELNTATNLDTSDKAEPSRQPDKILTRGQSPRSKDPSHVESAKLKPKQTDRDTSQLSPGKDLPTIKVSLSEKKDAAIQGENKIAETKNSQTPASLIQQTKLKPKKALGSSSRSSPGTPASNVKIPDRPASSSKIPDQPAKNSEKVLGSSSWSSPRKPASNVKLPKRPASIGKKPGQPAKSGKIPGQPAKSGNVSGEAASGSKIPDLPSSNVKVSDLPASSAKLPDQPAKDGKLPIVSGKITDQPTGRDKTKEQPAVSDKIEGHPAENHKVPVRPASNIEVPVRPASSVKGKKSGEGGGDNGGEKPDHKTSKVQQPTAKESGKHQGPKPADKTSVKSVKSKSPSAKEKVSGWKTRNVPAPAETTKVIAKDLKHPPLIN